MNRFVILAAPRTGSNLLCTLLNSHPQILCHHEVFNPQGIYTARGYDGPPLTVDSLALRDQDPLGFLERVWKTGTPPNWVGFKWTRGQNQTVLQRVVGDPSVRKIVLGRRNRVKTFVSEKIASVTQQWEVYSAGDLLMPRPRIRVDLAELRAHLLANRTFYDHLRSELRRLRQPHYCLDYESLLEPETHARLLAFLGLSTETPPLEVGSIKQNSTDLRDAIENFNELQVELMADELQAELCDRNL